MSRYILSAGAHIVTADEVPDPTPILSIPTLLEFQTVTLRPGDLNSSGACGGTGMGRTPQEFMHSGDTVTVGVTEVGYLTNPLEAGWEG